MKKLRLYSNSSISDYNLCGRLFYFRYILEWAPSGRSVPLVFGASWHRAMDVVWTRLVEKNPPPIGEVLDEAYQAFIAEWVESGFPHPSEMGLQSIEEYKARTPMNAQEMLIAYMEKRSNFIRSGQVELIEIEKPFAIPLDPDDKGVFYVGKIDKVIKHIPYSKIRGMEHKTTTAYKKGTGDQKFQTSFLDSFTPNSQVDGYIYTLHMYYPGKVGGIWVDGALVHKTEQSFVLIPIEHQIDQLEMWLWETRSTVDEIEANIEAAAEVKEGDQYMAAFRRDTRSCYSMYGASCPYLIPCRSWANPKGKSMPRDYQHSPWNPLEHIRMKKEDLTND